MSDDLSQELRAFEGSEALANGDFSVCIRGADRIEAQAARIAQLEAAQGRLILSFRLNLLRINPRLSHETISKAIEVALTGGKDE